VRRAGYAAARVFPQDECAFFLLCFSEKGASRSNLWLKRVSALGMWCFGVEGGANRSEWQVLVGWKRPADHSKAVGVFNRQPAPLSATVDFRALGFPGTVSVRDIWQAKDLGQMEGPFMVTVPARGVVLLLVR
jgi:hypothetical protein